ncbi:AbiJ-NTD4 domain-containing protein [Nocardia wallacei]|uniref:AbiJ-NTD4 domain-containing protein n=1 Tax=Nocardia wallacei TaxID=480035 RepID=UPI002457C975|nr:hypothetical protein [Nocardia wallacei]
MKFSQRLGYVPVRKVAQVEEIDADLRTDLWNLVYTLYFNENDDPDEIFRQVWVHHFFLDLDKYPQRRSELEAAIKIRFKSSEWYEVYDLIEAILEEVAENKDEDISTFNYILERNLAGYRVTKGEVVPISDTGELKEIEQALSVEHDAVQHHLGAAVSLLSNRTEPDYPNSVKESISAVEALAGSLTGKNTLGGAVDQLKRDGQFSHPALLDAWKKMYGYASDADGIRHGGENAPEVSQALARYILITASAFINLLTAAYAEGRTPPSR